jgi:Tol biopolymer transport system component
MMLWIRVGLVLALVGMLGGCVGSPRILTLPFDGGGRGFNSPYNEVSGNISGRYVVFVSDRQGSQDIYLFDMVARQLVPLPNLNRFDTVASDPAVSEDGNWIVFGGSREGRSGIYLYNRSTQQVRWLTRNLNAEVRNPTLSADGQRIAFEVNVGGQWDITVYDRNGNPLNIPTNAR